MDSVVVPITALNYGSHNSTRECFLSQLYPPTSLLEVIVSYHFNPIPPHVINVILSVPSYSAAAHDRM
jgi:hypothetical protein